MMKDWKKVKISDLGNVITGNTPPRKNPEFYGTHTIFIKPTDIQEDVRYTRNPEECYSDMGYKKYIKSLIPKGSTCVVTIGSIGKKITQAHCDCFVNQAINAIVPNNFYDNDFIFYLLKNNLNQVKGLDSGTASGRENVSKSTFSSIEMFVPESIETQQKIASILSAYDDLIENNLRRIKLLEEMAAITYKEWFVNFTIEGEKLAIDETTGLPFGWERKSLVEIANLTMGQSPESKFYNEEGIGIPFHQGVTGYGFRFPTNKTWSAEGSRFAEKGDILFSVRAPVGRLNISIEKIILGRGLASVRHKEEWNSFLYYQLKYIFFKDDIMGGGSIFNSVTKKDVELIQIIQGKTDIMRKFNKIVEPIDTTIENLETQNRLLKESRDILLPRLMSGAVNLTQ